jgi:hypothetical protein
MSFEGQEIHICRHGHVEYGPLSYGEATEPCCCGESPIWIYIVDETNDSGVGPELELFQYYIPSNDGIRSWRAPSPGFDATVPQKPVKFRDLDHPDDGPFATEHEAWANKARYCRGREKE